LKLTEALQRNLKGVEEGVLIIAADNIVKPEVMPPGIADPIAAMIQLAREAGVGTLSCSGRKDMLATIAAESSWPAQEQLTCTPYLCSLGCPHGPHGLTGS